ncbi:MAG TPA: hypothetical protein VEO74_02605, partial [Thermoanaerobaculia bacterium]|nr:hypothetical protein [Thermoanaerobaculia bacterium]
MRFLIRSLYTDRIRVNMDMASAAMTEVRVAHRAAGARPWMRIVVASAAVGALIQVTPGTETDLTRRLLASSTSSSRDIEARLSGGIRWAPLKPLRQRGATVATDHLEILMAAREIAERARVSSNRARYAFALADILTGNAEHAIGVLEALAAQRNQPELWNDLAVAQYEAALATGDPSRLAVAIAAADAALRAAPTLAEARFNRALIIERLGLRDRAREEWETYLRTDPSSEWSGEARQHIRDLSPDESFATLSARNHDHFLSSPGEAAVLAVRYPQEARVAAEEEILGHWGEELLRGNNVVAANQLRLARAIGTALVKSGGDELLPAMTAAIDSADVRRRLALANAHKRFREGRALYRSRKL